MSVTKPTNPKDICANGKPDVSTIPVRTLFDIALGMGEGGCKYGPYNWREMGVLASVYYKATQRHLMCWFEGEDLDPDSGLSHITKAITSLIVLRDAMLCNNWRDDRPIRPPNGWFEDNTAQFKALYEKYPEPKARFLERKDAIPQQERFKLTLHNVE
jgi:hypothetical protein